MQAGRKGCPGGKSSQLAAGNSAEMELGNLPATCTLIDGNDRSWFTDKAQCPGMEVTDDDWVEVDHGDGDIVHKLKNGVGVSSCPGKAEINSMCGWHLVGDNCLGTRVHSADTLAKHFDGCDGRAKLNAFGGGGNVTQWEAGSVQTVAWSVATPHGGLTTYALCPVEQMGKDFHRDGATSKCFAAGRLKYANNKTCAWTAPGEEWLDKGCYESKMHDEYWMENWPRYWKHDKANYPTMGVKNEVIIPGDLPNGRYVLSWEWDTDENQIWQSCADVEIIGGPAPTPQPEPIPTPYPTPEPPVPTPLPTPPSDACTLHQDMGTTNQNPVGVETAGSADDCCSSCTQNPECTHFIYYSKGWSNGNCKLKTGVPQFNDQTQSRWHT
jgi:hypothetical protein